MLRIRPWRGVLQPRSGGTALTASGGRREPGPPAPPQLLPQDHSPVGCSRPPATAPLPEESGSRSEAPASGRARDKRPEVTYARAPRFRSRRPGNRAPPTVASASAAAGSWRGSARRGRKGTRGLPWGHAVIPPGVRGPRRPGGASDSPPAGSRGSAPGPELSVRYPRSGPRALLSEHRLLVRGEPVRGNPCWGTAVAENPHGRWKDSRRPRQRPPFFPDLCCLLRRDGEVHATASRRALPPVLPRYSPLSRSTSSTPAHLASAALRATPAPKQGRCYAGLERRPREPNPSRAEDAHPLGHRGLPAHPDLTHYLQPSDGPGLRTAGDRRDPGQPSPVPSSDRFP
ncbi:serine/arginine repetitive matrix protein 3-like [Enhydra lutris kenyoni]|uniref:Serine/arginine repetitive matrix protein 3-like n=1 Tax=Enhydra lutris kenyoni TaxID=391180 RepID=A0A2Y9JC38_ENHLU|nr:serine/arginine repetitive matrix protein 3-like [Enhydra lutris kenyoni]